MFSRLTWGSLCATGLQLHTDLRQAFGEAKGARMKKPLEVWRGARESGNRMVISGDSWGLLVVNGDSWGLMKINGD
jgi:hypothetical protein